jgi:hypothetical protein
MVLLEKIKRTELKALTVIGCCVWNLWQVERKRGEENGIQQAYQQQQAY